VDSYASPTARALLALEVIQSGPGVTADQLASKLGVSERAARRYVGILREAGVPIDSVRGPYGGYRLGRGLRLPPLMFSAPEALGLVMAVLDGHHAAGNPTDPVGSALGKLVRALPKPVAAQAEAVRRTAAPAPDRAAARPDPETTLALVQACANRRPVRIGYRSEAGSEWSIEADPWAVVVRHGRWYLLCWSHRAAARRAYRIDRVDGVEVLDGTVEPPADLDPVAVLEEHLAVGWEYEVDVVIEAAPEAVACRLPRTLGRLEPVDAGTTRLVGSTSNPWWYAEQLAAIPVPYRILGCEALQQTARAIAGRMLAAAGPAGSPGEPGDGG
jgi:predicted DNA-binding transcriptional regulator YafY